MDLKLYPTKEDWKLRWEMLKGWLFKKETDTINQKISLTQNAQLLLVITLIISVVSIVDWPVLSCQALTYDDGQYLTNNELVKAVNWESCRRFFVEVFSPSTVGGYYQPLTMLSLMLDFLFAGEVGDLIVFHRTNLILHIINSTLMVIFIYILFQNVWVAGLCGLLFGLHPTTIESLAWISERKTLLSTMFSMSALIIYLRAKENHKLYLVISLVMYILALMSKPICLPLPLVMLLLDFWPLQRLRKNAVFEKGFFYFFGLVFGVISFISQKNTAGVFIPFDSPIFKLDDGFNIFKLFLAIIWELFFYITKFFWPFPISHRYQFPRVFTLSDSTVLLSFIGAFLFMIFFWRTYPKFKALTVGISIFVVMLLPTIGIIGVTNTLVSNRYLYLPSIGLIIVVAAIFNLIHKKLLYPDKRILIIGSLSLLCILAIIGEIYSLRSFLAVWKDSETLARHSVKMSSQDPYAYFQLGSVLMEKRDYPGAIAAYQTVLKLQPLAGEKLYYALGNAYLANQDYEEALKCYQECIKQRPQSYLSYYLIGNLFYNQKKYEEAIFWYNQALERGQKNFYTNMALERAYRMIGDLGKAEHFLSEAKAILSTN